jgi:hypothetical protein
MSHIVKLGSVATVRVQFLTGAAITQNDPGVQTASRGTGATFINPANDPEGFIAFFNDGLNRFQDVESVPGRPCGNNGRRQGSVSSRQREITNDRKFQLDVCMFVF